MNWRMIAPATTPVCNINVNGRNYLVAGGSVNDVPDFDGQVLSANGWTLVAPSGPTSGRPTGVLPPYAAVNGAEYFDTTLGYVIRFGGGAWRNPATGAVV